MNEAVVLDDVCFNDWSEVFEEDSNLFGGRALGQVPYEQLLRGFLWALRFALFYLDVPAFDGEAVETLDGIMGGFLVVHVHKPGDETKKVVVTGLDLQSKCGFFTESCKKDGLKFLVLHNGKRYQLVFVVNNILFNQI